MYPHILTSKTVTMIIDGKQYTTNNTSPNWDSIIDKIRNDNTDGLSNLFSLKDTIVDYSDGKISISEGKLYHGSVELHSTLATRIISFFNDDLPIDPLIKFLQKTIANENKDVANDLYQFLENGKLPITAEGNFLAYKKVRDNFNDIFTNTISNAPGKFVKMKRDLVELNRKATCSSGLHFCSKDYLKEFSSSNNPNSDRIVIVEIDPTNVVSIPYDYNLTKGRCCEYRVLCEYNPTEHERDVFGMNVVQVATPYDDPYLNGEDDYDDYDDYDDDYQDYYGYDDIEDYDAPYEPPVFINPQSTKDTLSALSLTPKQKIVYAFVDQKLKDSFNLSLVEFNDSVGLQEMRLHFNDFYEEIVTGIIELLNDVTRDHAVSYLKAIRDAL